MHHLLSLALVIGCSDRSAPGASDAGADASRPRGDAGAMRGEACDGTDDDRDGSVDEGCECDVVGDVRPCDTAECATSVQRCVNQDEFGSAWSRCESADPRGPECVDAGAPPPFDAGMPSIGTCGRASATGDPRDTCWAPATIPVDAGCTPAGAYKRFDPVQGLWVGVVECSSAGFRVFLSDPAFGDWRPATDGAGHGQDHCELFDPAFRIPDEDDITSGGCATCSAGGLIFSRGGVYARHRFGECFTEETAVMDWPWLTSVIYCGVSGAALRDSGDRCRAAM